MIHPMPKLSDGRMPVVTSSYEWRGNIFHYGVDFFYPRKNETDDVQERWVVPRGTSAICTWDGEVLYSRNDSRGHAVRVRHANGLETAYRHLYRTYVDSGDKVKAGQALGEVGDDPTNDGDGRHLHFEIWRDGEHINPEIYLSDAIVVPDPRRYGLLTGIILTLTLAGVVFYLIK